MTLTAFVGATLVDATDGTQTPHATVLVRDGRVVDAGEPSRVPVPSDAEQVDVSGTYLLPGFMDGNVHLVPWPSWSYIEFLARYEDRFHEVAIEGAQLALKAGFTSVFDSMGPLDALIRARDDIATGRAVGARIAAAGNIVGFRAVFITPESIASASTAFQKRINDRFEARGGPDLCWLPPRDLYRAMLDYVDQGVDFVKYGATGDGAPLTSEIGQANVLRFTPAQQKAIVDAVHDRGLICQTHTTSAESLHIAVEAGNDMGQHATFVGRSRIADETVDLMLERGYHAGTQWAPLTDDQRALVAQGRWDDPGLAAVLDNVGDSRRLVDAGVPMLVTTDAGWIDPDVALDDRQWGGLGGEASLIGRAEFANMRAMADRGMSPLQIIQAATINVARAYGVERDFGTVEAGKVADFTLLSADPMDGADRMDTVVAVVQNGRMVDRDVLPSHPVLTHPAAQEPGAIRRIA
jgi:imidazolonepropionase-like amidohydrolase